MASPELQWAIDTIAADRARAGVSADRHDVQAGRAALPPTDQPLPEGTGIRTVIVGAIACHWVCAPGADPDRRLVYFHGGGYQGGGFHSHRSLVGWLSRATGCAVLFPEYRLAPEHRFPAAVEDAFAATRWAADHGPDGRPGPARSLVVGGDSAGGGLAFATVQLCRDRDCRRPDAAFSLCGMLDLDETTSAFLRMTQRTRDGVRQYVRWLADLRNPLASPVLADLRGFPPVLLQTGSADYCIDDSARFHERAQAAAIDSTLEVWPEMIHVWHRFAPRLPEALEALDAIARWIDRAAGATTGEVSHGRDCV